MKNLILILCLIFASSCDSSSNIVDDSSELDQAFIQTKADSYTVDFILNFYIAEIDFTYTNLTDSSVFIPQCGSTTPPQPHLEKLEDDEWKVVYTQLSTLASCESFIEVQPDGSYVEGKLTIDASPQGTLNSEPVFNSPQIDGEYRLVWKLYNNDWGTAAIPNENDLAPLEQRVSNTFTLVLK